MHCSSIPLHKATGRLDEGSAAVGVGCAAHVVAGVNDDAGICGAGNYSTPSAGNSSEGLVDFGGGDSDLGALLGDELAQVSKGMARKDLSSVGKDDRSGATVAGAGKGEQDGGAVVVESGVDAVVTGDAGGGDRTGSDKEGDKECLADEGRVFLREECIARKARAIADGIHGVAALAERMNGSKSSSVTPIPTHEQRFVVMLCCKCTPLALRSEICRFVSPTPKIPCCRKGFVDNITRYGAHVAAGIHRTMKTIVRLVQTTNKSDHIIVCTDHISTCVDCRITPTSSPNLD